MNTTQNQLQESKKILFSGTIQIISKLKEMLSLRTKKGNTFLLTDYSVRRDKISVKEYNK